MQDEDSWSRVLGSSLYLGDIPEAATTLECSPALTNDFLASRDLASCMRLPLSYWSEALTPLQFLSCSFCCAGFTNGSQNKPFSGNTYAVSGWFSCFIRKSIVCNTLEVLDPSRLKDIDQFPALSAPNEIGSQSSAKLSRASLSEVLVNMACCPMSAHSPFAGCLEAASSIRRFCSYCAQSHINCSS